MYEEEALELIKNSESGLVEFKETFNDPAKETVGAFSNTKGGYVFIGIADDGTIKGAQIGRETIAKWASDISNSTQPHIVPAIHPLKINERDVVVIEVKESRLKPVAVRGKCYKRVNRSNHLLTPQEISEMYHSCVGISPDSLPLLDAGIDDIDREKVRKYIRMAISSGRKVFDTDDPLFVLEKLGLIRNGLPTLASIILFGKSPAERLPYMKVHCGRFKDETTIIDDKYVEGTALEQVDEVIAFIRKNTNVKYAISGKPERDEIWDYPPEALREAVINAI